MLNKRSTVFSNKGSSISILCVQIIYRAARSSLRKPFDKAGINICCTYNMIHS